MKLKHIVAAGLLAAAASSANAAIDVDDGTAFGTGDGGGELFVSVFRNVAGSEQSYLIDTGFTATQLVNGGVADGTILGNVGSFFSTAPTASFSFNAGAVANDFTNGGPAGGIFTSNNAAAVADLAAGAAADPSVLPSVSQQLALFGGSANGGSTDYANNDDFAAISPGSPGYHDQLAWGSDLGGAVSFSTEGSLDTALSLWAVVYSADFTSVSRIALGFLTAQSATGDIVYNASVPQVPLPGAVWLLGSALIGMSAIRRRRNNGVVAAAA